MELRDMLQILAKQDGSDSLSLHRRPLRQVQRRPAPLTQEPGAGRGGPASPTTSWISSRNSSSRKSWR